MIFIQFEAMPSQRFADRDKTAGAYVNCWVNVDDPSNGELRARQWIAEHDWVVTSLVECRTVNLDAEINGAGAKFISEALDTGGSIVFHTWPHSGESAVD